MQTRIIFILLMAIIFPVAAGQGFNWENDPQKSKITIRHLATHSSGIEDSEVSEKDRAEAKAKGIWDGKQVISSELVERVTAYAGTPLPPRGEKIPSPACGLAWYNNFDGIWPHATDQASPIIRV